MLFWSEYLIIYIYIFYQKITNIMIAVDLGFIKIYRYGIFYAISFIAGYYLLKYLAKYIYAHHNNELKTASLYRQIYEDIDNIIVYIAVGVIAGGRLGEVLIYNLSYYFANPIKILAVQDGWMSFVGGYIWVMLAIFYYKRQKKFSFDEILAVFDLIVLVLPMWIVLGRWWNYLNQELIGQTINSINQKYTHFGALGNLSINPETCLNRWFCHIYPRIDTQIRLNNNLFEALLEGFLTGIVGIYIWIKKYRYNIKPGLITGIFMVIYSIWRIIMESFRDNPPSEYIYGLLKSQLWMIWFFLFGIWLIYRSKNIYSKN